MDALPEATKLPQWVVQNHIDFWHSIVGKKARWVNKARLRLA